MLVRDQMSSPALTVRDDEDYKVALRMMQENALHHLPVVDADGQVVGMAAERDLVLAATRYLQSAVEVGEVMHRGAVTTRPDVALTDAVGLMLRHRIGGLPVVDADQHLVGLITETDIFKVFVKMADDQTSRQLPLAI